MKILKALPLSFILLSLGAGVSALYAQTLPTSFSWTSTGPLISPKSDSTHNMIAVKDPSAVFYNGQYIVYASSVNSAGNYGMEYLHFSNWSQAGAATPYFMDSNSNIGGGYHTAPQVFYFAPQNKWYLIFQSGQPQYSTNSDPTQPQNWSAPKNFFSSQPSSVSAWIDFWIISDSSNVYLFFCGDNGNFYRSSTSLANFPNGFNTPVIVYTDSQFNLFEADNVYTVEQTGTYLANIECIGSDGHRFFRALSAPTLGGTWTALGNTANLNTPFLGAHNVTFQSGVTTWTDDFSSGGAVIDGYDSTDSINLNNLTFLYQGDNPNNGASSYNLIPWQLGLASSKANMATSPTATPTPVLTATSTPCAPTTITPYYELNWGAWTQANSVMVSSLPATVNLGPQPLTGGSWNWAGPSGFNSTAREIDNIPLSVGTNNFTATYTNACGAKSTQTFTVTVQAPPTATATDTFSRTNTPVPPTATATSTATSTASFTRTSTPTNTAVPPTATPTLMPANTATSTATNTTVPPTSTFTSVPPTMTFTSVPPTVTNTAVPPTNTPVPPTATNTPMPPTATNTPVPPTSTFTAVPPTATNTAMPPTFTFTPTSVPPTMTFTSVPPTVTNTPVPPTATFTMTPMPPTATRTFTSVPPTATDTPVPPTPTDTAVAASGSFKVQLLSAVTGTNTNSPHPQLQIVNTGSGPLDLNNVTVRYWFNCDCTNQTVQAWVDWAGLIPQGTNETGNVEVSVQPTSLGGQTNYVLYSFTGNMVLQPGQALQIQSRFNKSDWSSMNQDNDWSFQPYTSYTNATDVTGYVGAALVWGQQPTGSSAALAVSSAMPFPNPSTGNGTTLSFKLNGNSGGTKASVDSGSPMLVDPNAKITLSVYTLSMRLIWTETLTGGAFGSTGQHDLYWNEKDLKGSGLANGVYLLKVTVESNGQTSSTIARILILG